MKVYEILIGTMSITWKLEILRDLMQVCPTIVTATAPHDFGLLGSGDTPEEAIDDIMRDLDFLEHRLPEGVTKETLLLNGVLNTMPPRERDEVYICIFKYSVKEKWK